MAAFCNPTRTHLPVGATCRFSTSVPPGAGRPWICENILHPTQVMQAFELIEGLYLHSNPALGLQTVHSCDWVLIGDRVRRIVSLLLCSQHGSIDAVQTLTDHYLEAIRNVAAAELSNAQALHKKTVELYKSRINSEYSAKAARPNASAKSPFGSAKIPQQPFRNPWSHPPPQPTYEHKRRRTTNPHPHDSHISRPTGPNPAFAASRPWSNIFQNYRKFWQGVENSDAQFDTERTIDQQIIFPVHTGNAAEVTDQAVNEFLREVLRSPISGTHTADKLLFLRKERLRWHPDKIDQRFNGLLGVEKVKELAGVIIQQINRFADAEKGGNGK